MANLNEQYPYTGAWKTLVIPEAGLFEFIIRGASGGDNGANVGGYGAEIVGTLNLLAGEVLKIFVGQQGWSNPNIADYGGGGGGATWVRSETRSVWFLVAGGGGGRGDDRYQDTSYSDMNADPEYDASQGDWHLADGETGIPYANANGGYGATAVIVNGYNPIPANGPANPSYGGGGGGGGGSAYDVGGGGAGWYGGSSGQASAGLGYGQGGGSYFDPAYVVKTSWRAYPYNKVNGYFAISGLSVPPSADPEPIVVADKWTSVPGDVKLVWDGRRSSLYNNKGSLFGLYANASYVYAIYSVDDGLTWKRITLNEDVNRAGYGPAFLMETATSGVWGILSQGNNMAGVTINSSGVAGVSASPGGRISLPLIGARLDRASPPNGMLYATDAGNIWGFPYSATPQQGANSGFTKTLSSPNVGYSGGTNMTVPWKGYIFSAYNSNPPTPYYVLRRCTPTQNIIASGAVIFSEVGRYNVCLESTAERIFSFAYKGDFGSVDWSEDGFNFTRVDLPINVSRVCTDGVSNLLGLPVGTERAATLSVDNGVTWIKFDLPEDLVIDANISAGVTPTAVYIYGLTASGGNRFYRAPVTELASPALGSPRIYAGDTLTTPPKKGTKLYAGLGANVPTEIGMAYVGDANGVPVPWFG